MVDWGSNSRGPLPLATTDRVVVGAEGSRGVPGQMLAGKYQLVEEIGRGGMGSVWRGTRLGWDDAEVAVKLMAPTLDSPLARERFEREARLAAKVRSPHVVHMVDYGIDEPTDTPFLVMELLEGQSLGSLLQREKVLSPRQVMTLVTQIGRALTVAHGKKVVHRDLKPDNVFLVTNGDELLAKVLDFGLARAFEVAPLDSRAVTAQGNAVGTPHYMSPEQIRGAVRDHFGDLWSLAVITCECLVGQRPFVASDLPKLTLLLCNEPRPVPSRLGPVPAGFDAWFVKATHPDIEQRFRSAQELVDALGKVCGATRREHFPPLDHEKLSPPRAPSLAAVTRPSESRFLLRRRFHVTFAYAVVGLVIGLIAIGAYVLLPGRASVTQSASVTSSQALTPAPTPAPVSTAPPGAAPPRAAAPQGQGSAAVPEALPGVSSPGQIETAPAAPETSPAAETPAPAHDRAPPKVEPAAPSPTRLTRPAPHPKRRRLPASTEESQPAPNDTDGIIRRDL